MAYPFVHFPTWGEFINRVTSSEFGCKYETVEAPMMVDGDEDQCISIHFLSRVVDGERRTYTIYPNDYEARMAPSVLRSVCARLEIPTTEFGFTLG